MRVAVLMNTAIPWACEAARGLSAMAHEVQAIAFAEWSADAHPRAEDEYQNEELRQLRAKAAAYNRSLVTERANGKNSLRTLSAVLEGLCANGSSRL